VSAPPTLPSDVQQCLHPSMCYHPCSTTAWTL
jgi:hypothetical protein